MCVCVCARARVHARLHCMCIPSKCQEGSVGDLLELLELLGTRPPHPLHHLLAQLHGWWHGLGVSPQDVAKVNVEQLACVIKMHRPLSVLHAVYLHSSNNIP